MVAQAPGQRCNPCMIEHYMLGPHILLKYFFVRYNGAPSKNRQTQEKQNKANTIPTKKTEKTLQNKPKSKQTQKKHCMFDSKCCCAWFSFWNCRYGSLRLKLHYPLAQDFRYLIGPCHFQPPGSTVKVENFQMKHMKISGTLSQDTLNNYQVLDFQDLAKSWIAKTWFYIYTF